MSKPKSDIEIAREAKLRPIAEIAKKLGIGPEHLEPYGHYKAKIPLTYIKSLESKPDGTLILMTAMTPTTAGEGKTTTSVGLCDGLNYIGHKAIVALREPSLGPVFGMKGGAAGGGYARKSCPWRISICISPATCTRSAPRTICSRRWSTTISIGATIPRWTRAA